MKEIERMFTYPRELKSMSDKILELTDAVNELIRTAGREIANKPEKPKLLSQKLYDAYLKRYPKENWEDLANLAVEECIEVWERYYAIRDKVSFPDYLRRELLGVKP